MNRSKSEGSNSSHLAYYKKQREWLEQVSFEKSQSSKWVIGRTFAHNNITLTPKDMGRLALDSLEHPLVD